MLDKRTFKKIYKDCNLGHTITIHKANYFHVGCIDGIQATNFRHDFDECLNDTREMLNQVLSNKEFEQCSRETYIRKNLLTIEQQKVL